MESLIFDERVIAVVGVAKNCGKTTTLNALTTLAADRMTLGLVSSGIDGERRDVLLGTTKPPIAARAGEFLATTRLALEQATATFEFVRDLGFDTPLGEAVIVRVLEAGEVVLAGMRHREDLAAATEQMLSLGADQVWIDGAYGRIASAHPELAEGVVVATGAVVAADVDGIATATDELIERLTLPGVNEGWERDLLEAALAGERVLLGGEAIEPIALGAASALLALPDSDDHWTPETTAVAIPGLVSNRVIEELRRFDRPGGELLIGDPTQLQADGRLLARFRGAWDVRVGKTCKLLAVSYNPTSITGNGVDPRALRGKLVDRHPKTPVFDPLVGIH